MAGWFTYLEYSFYLSMLCLMVPFNVEKEDADFSEYIKKFNKSYDNETVFNLRLEAFKNSLNSINMMNRNRTNNSAYYGLTKFSDLLPEEFLSRHLSQIAQNTINLDDDFSESKHYSKRSARRIPSKVDWRVQNVTTKIKNQHKCGACWAFSIIATVESMYAIKHGKLLDLSVQQMIDCSTLNKGCDGGDLCRLLQWIKANNIRIEGDDLYPLRLQNMQCITNASLGIVDVEDYSCAQFIGNEDVMLDLIARLGPITVAVNAKTWQNYAGGIIQYHCDDNPLNLNHAVQLVGYDLTADVPHYIARNSWGEDFGDGGYLYIAYGGNVCGVANEFYIHHFCIFTKSKRWR
ncbi:unnamed protein product [Brassicogethes aeneus]|uniref:Cathepsin O n=1 Tax=Brassicogethes aeneus TaxID=1431903 RepID=A0A9P0BGE2_BRAAE|nr:unnamed protein product [Brassicogethes aeneus]